ncbi:MAG: hypothetical protein PHF67_01560 [Candidatus Nanoarchaeia archaeon]|nr:hypothetical protein [Candidatus Nanoarchaeia archaeon]
MDKKAPITLFLAIILSLTLVSAINLDVKTKSVSNAVVTDLNKPAIFDLTITNLGEGSSYTIFSLVGVDITPKDSFIIGFGQTKTIRIEVMPQESLKSREGPLTLEYQIMDSRKDIQKEQLSIDISSLANSIIVKSDDINIDSEKIRINLDNRLMYKFDDMKIKLDSVFFNYEENLSFKNYEDKIIEVPIDKEKLKKMDSGNYIIQVEIQFAGKKVSAESKVRYAEKENVIVTETNKGVLIQKHEILKENFGNVKRRVTTIVEKNLFTYFFTSSNIDPSFVKSNGLTTVYTWEKDLSPGDELDVIVTTNWLYPIIAIVLLILIIVFIVRYIKMDVVFRKNLSFVKTNGGEFALKVQIRVKARRHLENIKITDKIPHIVTLYEKFGAIAPDNIDMKNRKLQWNAEALNKGEEKIFSYIVYSKIGVFGKFELPVARATYQLNGELKEATSNKAFYVNKPKKI